MLERSSAGLPYIVLDYLCRDMTSIISEVSNSEEVLANLQSDDLHEFTHHLPSKVSNNRRVFCPPKSTPAEDAQLNELVNFSIFSVLLVTDGDCG